MDRRSARRVGLLIGFTLGTALAPLAGAAAPAVRAALTLLGAWVGGVVAARRAPELPALPPAARYRATPACSIPR